ncbi:MAG TPA: GGDEF domain-containing protein [Pirellulales bacterium]
MTASFDPILIVAVCATAIPFLLGGIAAGWYTRGVQETPEEEKPKSATPPAEPAAAEPAAPPPSPKMQNMLSRLHDLADATSREVEEHTSRVDSINRKLNSLSAPGSKASGASVLEAATQLLQANERLHAELASTRSRLDEHGRQLEARMTEARTDGLTGVANRRALDEELNRRFAEFVSGGDHISLVLLDVDHFKKFNDTHGHQAGDEVLRGVGRILRETVKEAGFVARFGGEEFAVIAPRTKAAEATGLAERVRQAIAAGRFPFEGTDLQVTASLGVAEAATAGKQAADLVQRADEALYSAKKAGRNRTHRFNGKSCEPAVRNLAAKPQPAHA